MAWYAIFTQTGKEDYIHSKLEDCTKSSNSTFIVPKRLLLERHKGIFVEVVKVMFPGYVLIETEDINNVYQNSTEIKYIYSFLKSDDNFAEIPLEEVSRVIYMADHDGLIGTSDVYSNGDMIEVLSGPLKNYVGFIKKIDKHKRRAKVLFKFNGRDHFIDLSVNILHGFD